jgi:hypothetical protein
MARAHLQCAICNRIQGRGLLSGASWQTVNGNGTVCPTCQSKYEDWAVRATEGHKG